MRLFRVLAAAAIAVAGALSVAAPANAATINYVALGDSYSSGVGTGNYYSDSGSCYRSPQAYAPLWVASHIVNSFSFLACSGAKTGDVLNNQLGTLNSGTSLVTISIGGNDVGFTDVVTTCTLYDDQTCINAVNQAKATATNVLPGLLNNVYTAIRNRAPNARVIVLGYPHLYQVPGSCYVGLSDTKRSAINSGSDTLAQVIAGRVAAYPGFSFIDGRTVFAGHEICSGDWWLNSLSWPVMESYHPNTDGQQYGYYPALRAVTG
jgi:lysophospholipase L1-like esterase